MTAPTADSELERGREAYARAAWKDAYESLSAADRRTPLAPDDRVRLATATYMVGREPEHLACLERAHHEHLSRGEEERAVRCAFWLALTLSLRGETARSTGWLGRGQRLLAARDSVEQGYLRVVASEHRLRAGDVDGAYAESSAAAEIGQRFGDADLLAIAVHDQGKMRLARSSPTSTRPSRRATTATGGPSSSPS
jgi:hypothetical protein